MDSEQSGIKFEKLNDSNFHSWKGRMLDALSIKDLDVYIDEDPPTDEAELLTWKRKDRKARAIIGFGLSDIHYEQVQHASSAKDMWTLICDIYEKHTLSNEINAYVNFFSAKMKDGERVSEYATRVVQLGNTLKSMGGPVEDRYLAIVLLKGLPERYAGLICALDALNTSDRITFDFVKSRCMQEEQRQLERDQEAHKKSEVAALLAAARSRRDKCIHCNRTNHSSNKCFIKYPHLKPKDWVPWRYRNNNSKDSADRGGAGAPASRDQESANLAVADEVCLAAYEKELPAGSC